MRLGSRGSYGPEEPRVAITLLNSRKILLTFWNDDAKLESPPVPFYLSPVFAGNLQAFTFSTEAARGLPQGKQSRPRRKFGLIAVLSACETINYTNTLSKCQYVVVFSSKKLTSSVVVFAARAICATDLPRAPHLRPSSHQVDIDPYSFGSAQSPALSCPVFSGPPVLQEKYRR